MKIKILLPLVVFSCIVYRAYGGQLEPSAPLGPTMKTLEDIYIKITSGTEAGTHNLYPSSSPSPTMYTLQQIYDAIPSGTATVSSSEVRQGKTYIQRSDGNMIFSTGTATLAGSENVKKGINNAWDGTGTLAPSGGTATPGDVLTGKTFYGSGQSDWTLQIGSLEISSFTEYDNQWDNNIDTNSWTYSGDSFTRSESNGWIGIRSENGYSSTMKSNDLKSLGRLICIPFKCIAHNTSDSTNSTSTNAVLKLIGNEGESLSLNLASGSTSVPGGSGKFAIYGAYGMFILQFEGNNLRIRVCGGSWGHAGGGGSGSMTVISDNTVTDISSWAFVKIKMESSVGGDGGNKQAEPTVGPIMATDTVLGSKGTKTDASTN